MDYDNNIEINTAQNVSLELPLAGIGSRLLAQIFDILVIIIFEMLMIIVFSTLLNSTKHIPNWIPTVSLILNFVLIWGYFPIMEYFNNGQTLGKKVFKIKVKSDMGGPLGFGPAIIRNLIRIVDFLPGFYGIGLLVMFLNNKNKRLGDIVSGTVVLTDYKTKYKTMKDIKSHIGEISEQNYDEKLLDIAKKIGLDDSKYQYIVNYIQRKDKLKAEVRNSILNSFFDVLDLESCPNCRELINSLTISEKETFVEILKRFYEK